MANFWFMYALLRINCVLRIEIDQIQEKLQRIKELGYLNLSVDTIMKHYRAQIDLKQGQIDANRSAADNIVAAALQH